MVIEGPEAFAIRMRSARLAARSLDVQTYLWHSDLTGLYLAHKLIEAADRGVKVRVLLDDMVRVAAGEADIGICFVTRTPAGTQDVASAAFPIGVVMAPSHPLASRQRITYDDCRGYPFLLSHGRWPIYDTLAPAFAELWDSLEPRISSNASPLLKRSVVAGRGIAFFSKLGFLKEIASNEAVWRPLDDPAINRLRVGILIGKHRGLPFVVRAFLDRLVRRLQDLENPS